jgi:hypothetical protein
MTYPVDRDGRSYDEYRHEILDDHELYELDRLGGQPDQPWGMFWLSSAPGAGHPTRKDTP